jgi:hypothetical protein
VDDSGEGSDGEDSGSARPARKRAAAGQAAPVAKRKATVVLVRSSSEEEEDAPMPLRARLKRKPSIDDDEAEPAETDADTLDDVLLGDLAERLAARRSASAAATVVKAAGSVAGQGLSSSSAGSSSAGSSSCTGKTINVVRSSSSSSSSSNDSSSNGSSSSSSGSGPCSAAVGAALLLADAASGAAVVGADAVGRLGLPAGRGGRVTLGRLLLAAPTRDQTTYISRDHATLFKGADGGLFLEDKSAANGARGGGQPPHAPFAVVKNCHLCECLVPFFVSILRSFAFWNFNKSLA